MRKVINLQLSITTFPQSKYYTLHAALCKHSHWYFTQCFESFKFYQIEASKRKHAHIYTHRCNQWINDKLKYRITVKQATKALIVHYYKSYLYVNVCICVYLCNMKIIFSLINLHFRSNAHRSCCQRNRKNSLRPGTWLITCNPTNNCYNYYAT